MVLFFIRALHLVFLLGLEAHLGFALIPNHQQPKPSHPREEQSELPSIFVREATKEDLPRLATLLTDAFFKENTNFFTYQIERLSTFLGIESRFSIFLSGARFKILLAYTHSGGNGNNKHKKDIIMGSCEVDDCVISSPLFFNHTPSPRPYMCNLAVDEKFRRMGVAKALISRCEHIVEHEWKKPILHLKLYDDNWKAKELYFGFGYSVEPQLEGPPSTTNADGKTIVLLRKTLNETLNS